MFSQRIAAFLFSLFATFIITENAPVGAQAPGGTTGAPQSLAFTSNRDGNNEIYVMDPDGLNQTRVTTAPTSNDQRPEISPDGSKIVFASNRDGNAEIFVMNFDGSMVRQLTFTAAPIANTWPRWSPDGVWIAFQSGTATDTQIFRIREDGNDLTQVTNYTGMNVFPAWSPDGTKMAIRRDADIYLINSVDGSLPARLTSVGTNNQMASYSPDGTKIAFLSNRDGYGSVYVMNADGTGQFNFTPRPEGRTTGWASRAPAWSPNGEFIYFTAVRSLETGDTNEQIWVKPFDGGAESKLTALGVNTEASVRRIVAPTIAAVAATPEILWPVTGKLIPVSLTVDVTDNSDPQPVCEITDVYDNEETEDPAWQISGPLDLYLRAERFGRLMGRVYTIAVTCTNSSDLSSTATANVIVPHDQRR